jgi:LCP family protein required for cell wall assembly
MSWFWSSLILDKLSDKYLGKGRGVKPRQPLSSPPRKPVAGLPRKPMSEALRKRVADHRRRQNSAFFIVLGVAFIVMALLWWPIYTATGFRTSPYRIIAGTISPIRALPSYFQGEEDIHLIVAGLDLEPPHRTDTVMVMHLDLSTLQARIVSVPRDLRVEMPDGGVDKLGHAYPFGEEREKQGMEWVRQSVEKLLGVDIPYYVLINFDGFIQLVDAMGGVDITVEKALKYRDRAQNLEIDIAPGFQHMDGETLLKYVRFRHDALGDIARMERQQKAILAVLAALKQGETYRRLPAVVSGMYDTFSTNLTPDQIYALSRQIPKIADGNIRTMTVPSDSTMMHGVSYQVANAEQVGSAVAFLEDLSPVVETSAPSGESNTPAADAETEGGTQGQ